MMIPYRVELEYFLSLWCMLRIAMTQIVRSTIWRDGISQGQKSLTTRT